MDVADCPLALYRLSARIAIRDCRPSGHLFATGYARALRDFDWVIAELLERDS